MVFNSLEQLFSEITRPTDGRSGTSSRKSEVITLEYSRHIEEKKSMPHTTTGVYAICWEMTKHRRFFGTVRPGDSSFFIQQPYPAGALTQLHTHNYIELTYVISGSFSQIIHGTEVEFGAGELCLIDKNCVHQDILSDRDAKIIFIGISKEMFRRITDGTSATDDRIINFLQSALLTQKDLLQYLSFTPYDTDDRRMSNTIGQLLSELCEPDTASPLICEGLLIRIFTLLSSAYDFSLSRELLKEKNWLIYEEITDYIRENYRDVSLPRLCDRFHFQQDYFARMLKKQTGMTFISYVQDVRLSEAKQRLLTTDASIEDIAEAVGYENKGYFYKIFTKKYGITPAKMRNQAVALTTVNR